MKQALVIANALFVSASVLAAPDMDPFCTRQSYGDTSPSIHKGSINSRQTEGAFFQISENSGQTEDVFSQISKRKKVFENSINKLENEANSLLNSKVKDVKKISMCQFKLSEEIRILNKERHDLQKAQLDEKRKLMGVCHEIQNRRDISFKEKESLKKRAQKDSNMAKLINAYETQAAWLNIQIQDLLGLHGDLGKMNERSFLEKIKSGFVNLVSRVAESLRNMVLSKK